MASLFNTSSMLVLSLILLTSFVPSSMAKNFRNIICRRTSNPSVCLNLDHVRSAPNTKGLAIASIEVALNKGTSIHSQLNANYRAEGDERLKDIYFICSKNYNDAIRDLTISQRNFDTKRFRVVPYELNDALEEIKACKTVFNGATNDPWNIREANEEFYLLTQIAEISAELLAKN